MPDPQQIDYDALAKQNGALSSVAPGATPSAPPAAAPMSSRARGAALGVRPTPTPVPAPVGPPATQAPDYDSLAKQNGALSSEPAQPATPPATAEDKPGVLERMYETSGLKGMIDSAKAKSDQEDALRKEVGDHIKNGRWGHAAETLLQHVVKENYLGPATPIIEGAAKSSYQHGKAAVSAIGQGDVKEAIAQGAEAVPFLGSVAEQVGEPLGRDLHDKNYRGAVGDAIGGTASIAALRAGGKGASELPEAATAAKAAIPEAVEIAGSKLPETVGQAATRANPIGVGSDIKGMEDVAAKLPMSGPLRKISEGQQAGARDVLANKAAQVAEDASASKAGAQQAAPAATAKMSSSPDAIEENATNAAQAIREAGNAKYEAIGQAAKDADISKAVDAASSIVSDDAVSKLLPKSARDSLSKLTQSVTERDSIAKQIYGKNYNDLEPAKQTEVGKALGGGDSSAGVTDVLKARSELAQAASSSKDAADRFQLHKALDSFDGAVDETLKAHDAKTGTKLSSDLVDAKKLWSQKYAFEEFRDGLQSMMRDQPHTGQRQINGAAFQKLVNDLDPRGAQGTTPLQRMFPGDTKSVSDLHALADFMGKNQGHAGGMATGMAKLRLLGLKESAAGLLANVSGFSWLMSRPGLARAALTLFQGGAGSAKIGAAVGELNAAAQESGKNQDSDQGPPTSLWQGKEGKRLTIASPDGRSNKWDLRNGVPTLVK